MSLFRSRAKSTSLSTPRSFQNTFHVYKTQHKTSAQTLLTFIIKIENGDLVIKNHVSMSPATNTKYSDNIKDIKVIHQAIEYQESESVRLIIQFNNNDKYWDLLFTPEKYRANCIEALNQVSQKLYSKSLVVVISEMKRPIQ